MTGEADSLGALKEQVERFRSEWHAVYDTLESNPAVYQPHLQHASLVQVDEAIDVVANWLERVRGPKGFRPMFQLSRSLAATSLAQATGAVQAIRRGEYAFFANLLVSLNQMTSALHSMLIFGEQMEARTAVAALGGQLAESLATLDTAHGELAAKATELAKADTLLARIASEAERLEVTAEQSDEAAARVAANEKAVSESKLKVDVTSQEISEEAERLEASLEGTDKLEKRLDDGLAALEDTVAKTRQQQDLIAALLPKGASAGLAAAFANRVGELERVRWMWAGLFVAAVIVLGIMGFSAHDELSSLRAAEVTTYLLKRIPIAGPAIWLAWFAAIQYGNTLRVQEDYAFKEATSKAFAGYRDHLEHLASVSTPEGANAMHLLAARTIEILAQQPLRLLGKTSQDATPATTVMDALKRSTRSTGDAT